jgi:segregation and condensation protein B
VIDAADIKRVVEAALLCAPAPLQLSDLRRLFSDDMAVTADRIRAALHELHSDWAGRGVELVVLAGGWRFQTVPELAGFIERLNPERPPRFSRAVLETLAIVAYRQPVTRGDIEAIRGVAVSSSIVKTLEDRGWIETVGYREVVGRPALWATTTQFLDDLGLKSLQDLPPLDRLPECVPGPGVAEVVLAGAAARTGGEAAPRAETHESTVTPSVSSTSEYQPEL